jgi:septum formation protein
LQLDWQEVTQVLFRPMGDAEREGYLAAGLWQNNSGAYAIQGPDDPYVRIVQGSLSNVIGMPMETLARVLPLLTTE